mmetsp:Transcript_22281/g.56888  ORF Transcript_22281/g.56888 Transcript_22281/m.56888 type:complete len:296 (-) Transcript_22281:2543-3430(-)
MHAHGDVVHLQILVGHDELVELDAQQPRRDARDVNLLVRHLVVGAHVLVVLGHDRGRLGVGRHDRVVPDLSAEGHRLQRRVLEQRLHLLGRLQVRLVLVEQVDGQRGCLGPFGDVDDLLEPRHAERHVLGGDAGVVEGVQGHLRGGLAHRLRGERADDLARAAAVLQEALLHLAQYPVERLRREAVLGEHALGRERRADVGEEVERGVALRLDREAVLALDDLEARQQPAHLLDDLHRRERRGSVGLELVRRLGHLDQAREVHADGRLRLALGERAGARVREHQPVLLQLRVLLA